MTITPLGPTPDRTDPETFSDRADATLGALPLFVTQANALEQQIIADKAAAAASASSATGSALEATNSAQVSQANANFKGVWSGLTGAATVPYSVFHEGKFWRLLVNLANVAASEPSATNADWKEAVAVGEIRTPTAIAPLDGADEVVPTPTLEASAYAPLYSVDDRLHRLFEVFLATDTAFASPVFSAEVNADSVTVTPLLALETAHVWRCKDVVELPDGSLLESDFMLAQQFTTAGISVNQPTLTVEGAPDDVPETPELTTSAFDTTPSGEDTHAATDWEVRKTSDNSLVFSSLNDTVNLLSITVPAGNLNEDEEYLFRARHIGTTFGAGPFAEVTATTIETFDIVPLLAVVHATTPFVTIYNQEIDTFTKLDNPATLPAGTGNKVTFSKDDVYMVVTHAISPFITIYKRSGNVFTKLANPSMLPSSQGQGVEFSSDNLYLAVANNGSPFLTIYKRDGDTFTKLADPATFPEVGFDVSFSTNADYLAVAYSASPFIAIYKRSGDTFTKLTNPATLPPNSAIGVSFSSNDTYLAVAHTSSPFVTIYKRNGDTFTKLTNPSTLPANNALAVKFSNDDVYLSVAHDTSPFVTIYKRDGDTFTKLTNPANLPTSVGFDVAFSSDSTYMAVAHTSSPFITIYKRSGDTFIKLADPSTLPAGNGRGVAFSNTGFPQ